MIIDLQEYNKASKKHKHAIACLCFLLALLYSSSPLLVVRELKETRESENKKAQSKIVDGYYMEDDGNYKAQL